jgi:hypothetical protein
MARVMQIVDPDQDRRYACDILEDRGDRLEGVEPRLLWIGCLLLGMLEVLWMRGVQFR